MREVTPYSYQSDLELLIDALNIALATTGYLTENPDEYVREQEVKLRAIEKEARKRKADRSSGPTGAPNVDGRDFYELCQQYRWERLDPVPQFEALKEYIRSGKLPWPSYEEDDARDATSDRS